ncbi:MULTISPECIES: hypothetical protein [Pseudomonas]|uniref:hypothetical protein n=1 Tax=Pseudomonas TaxID=286 RepID=UPI0011404616|nr:MULTISPECIES: hypothetical protein [Pseudomonas]
MAAKQKLRRENPYLVPRLPGYLSGRSSAFFRKISDFPAPLSISSVFVKTRLIFGAGQST